MTKYQLMALLSSPTFPKSYLYNSSHQGVPKQLVRDSSLTPKEKRALSDSALIACCDYADQVWSDSRYECRWKDIFVNLLKFVCYSDPGEVGYAASMEKLLSWDWAKIVSWIGKSQFIYDLLASLISHRQLSDEDCSELIQNRDLPFDVKLLIMSWKASTNREIDGDILYLAESYSEYKNIWAALDAYSEFISMKTRTSLREMMPA